MPKPHKDESKKDYISRCMAYSDMQKYDPDQRAAICYSMYSEAKKSEIIKQIDNICKSIDNMIGK